MIIKKFLKDVRGSYALMTAAAIVPIMGALALGVDYSEMSRQRQETLNALDAAGVATARRIVEGVTETEAKAYAKSFFEANLGTVNPANATLTVLLPANNTGGGTLKLTAALKYKPFFFPTFAMLIGKSGTHETGIDFKAVSEVRLKNTLEVALVLDNSASMKELGNGSTKVRFDLLKAAAKQLVDTLAGQASLMKQVDKPVQFALVPFAASVNVGSDKATATWMDTDGISPIHHENFDWTTMSTGNKKVQNIGGIWYKKGPDWGAQENSKVTRFSMYNDLQRQTGTAFVKTGTESYCKEKYWNGTCKTWGTRDVGHDAPVYSSYAGWHGCVEARPSPYHIQDTAPASATPATLFVPMFAPDSTDKKDSSDRYGYNNYWADLTTNTSNSYRQGYMPKYFTPAADGTSAATGDQGPNASCTTNPITPLVDVSTTAGLTSIKASIDAMVALGATNVPEGMAWGWRVLSHGAPYTEGRAETEKGNDKVVIVLTDGANTYYTPESLGANDLAGMKSIYSNTGFPGKNYNGTSTPRLFMDTSTSVSKTDFSNANYTKALNEHFVKLCDNVKNNANGTQQDKVMVITVALDLDENNTTEKAQIEALKKCSSNSRFTKDKTDPSKPAKMFYNTTGSDLSKTFKEIADELSNLRIVG